MSQPTTSGLLGCQAGYIHSSCPSACILKRSAQQCWSSAEPSSPAVGEPSTAVTPASNSIPCSHAHQLRRTASKTCLHLQWTGTDTAATYSTVPVFLNRYLRIKPPCRAARNTPGTCRNYVGAVRDQKHPRCALQAIVQYLWCCNTAQQPLIRFKASSGVPTLQQHAQAGCCCRVSHALTWE